MDIALEAFDQTYDWVVCVLRDYSETGLMAFFAPRVDATVIAAEDSASEPVVDLYERAREAGAPDVIVAREKAPVECSRWPHAVSRSPLGRGGAGPAEPDQARSFARAARNAPTARNAQGVCLTRRLTDTSERTAPA